MQQSGERERERVISNGQLGMRVYNRIIMMMVLEEETLHRRRI